MEEISSNVDIPANVGFESEAAEVTMILLREMDYEGKFFRINRDFYVIRRKNTWSDLIVDGHTMHAPQFNFG